MTLPVRDSDASRALVERLAGHLGIGESSRTARLTLVETRKAAVRQLTASDAWKVAHATDLGDGVYALTLLAGDADATAVVSFDREGDLRIDQCTDESAERFLRSNDGEYAAYQAAVFGRYGV